MDLNTHAILKALHSKSINTKECIKKVDGYLTIYYLKMYEQMRELFLRRNTINQSSAYYENGVIFIAINELIEENARLRKLIKEEGSIAGRNVADHSIDYTVPFPTASEIFKAFEHIDRFYNYDLNTSGEESSRTHESSKDYGAASFPGSRKVSVAMDDGDTTTEVGVDISHPVASSDVSNADDTIASETLDVQGAESLSSRSDDQQLRKLKMYPRKKATEPSVDFNASFSTPEMLNTFLNMEGTSSELSKAPLENSRTPDETFGSFKPKVAEFMTDDFRPGAPEVMDNDVLSESTSLVDVTGNTETFGAMAVSGNTETYGAAAVTGSPEVFGALAVAGSPEVFGRVAVAGSPEVFGPVAVAGSPEVFGAVAVAGNPESFGAVAVTRVSRKLVDDDAATTKRDTDISLAIAPSEMESNAGHSTASESLNVHGAVIPVSGDADQPLKRCKMYPPKKALIHAVMKTHRRNDSKAQMLQHISLDPCIDTTEHNAMVAHLFRECLKETRYHFISVAPHLNCTLEYNQCYWVLYVHERVMCAVNNKINYTEIYLKDVFKKIFQAYPLEIESVSLVSSKTNEWAFEISSPCNCWPDEEKDDEKEEKEEKTDVEDRKTDDKGKTSKEENLKRKIKETYESKGARPRTRGKKVLK